MINENPSQQTHSNTTHYPYENLTRSFQQRVAAHVAMMELTPEAVDRLIPNFFSANRFVDNIQTQQ